MSADTGGAAVPHDEAGMRAFKPDWPKTEDELLALIRQVADRKDHDYGTCVYAMSIAATAAFQYVASRLEVTGFQASCADMDILRRTRRMEGPFMIVNGDDALFPQYDMRGRMDEFLKDIEPWLAEQAAKKLEDTTYAHPDVIAHWKMLTERARRTEGK